MTRSDDDRQAFADMLRSLSLPELVDVLRRVLPAYDGEERNGLATKLVLAEATVFGETIMESTNNHSVDVEIVAWPDRDYYGGGFGPEPELYEQGHCDRCGMDVTSTAKQAFCAICGSLCYLT